MRRARSRKRPLLRTLSDALIFVMLLAMVLIAMRQSGLLFSDSGGFMAIDGDSLRKDGTEYRLHAIDAPELNQNCTSRSGSDYACGRDAKDELRRLVSGQTLDCRILETDRYGRFVAICSSGDLEINKELVRNGWAIAYRSHGLAYVKAEEEARAARRGIWQGQFEKPETWRQQHRNRVAEGSLGPEAPPD